MTDTETGRTDTVPTFSVQIPGFVPDDKLTAMVKAASKRHRDSAVENYTEQQRGKYTGAGGR